MSVNATGLSMLFSAGTFLYVATVHVLPEIAGAHQMSSPSNDPEAAVEIRHGFTWIELIALVAGSLSPLILSMGHHH